MTRDDNGKNQPVEAAARALMDASTHMGWAADALMSGTPAITVADTLRDYARAAFSAGRDAYAQTEAKQGG